MPAAGDQHRLVEPVDLVVPEDGVGGEVGEAQLPPAAQRVAPAEEDARRDRPDLGAGAPRGAQAPDGEEGVEVAGPKVRERLGANADGEARLYPKGLRHEARHNAADELVLGEGRRDEGKPQVASVGRPLAQGVGQLPHGLKALDSPARRLEQRLTEGREAHPAPLALEQLPAELLLELVHRLRDGLDRDALRPCGGGEVPRARRPIEELELSDVHACPPQDGWHISNQRRYGIGRASISEKNACSIINQHLIIGYAWTLRLWDFIKLGIV